MRIDVVFLCATIAIVCLLGGLLLGKVAWESDEGARALACLSSNLPSESSPDDCWQIREMLKRENSKTDLARTGIKLIQGAEDTMEALAISQARKEAVRRKPSWVKRLLRGLWGEGANGIGGE